VHDNDSTAGKQLREMHAKLCRRSCAEGAVPKDPDHDDEDGEEHAMVGGYAVAINRPRV